MIPYKSFSQFVIRTPLLSINYLKILMEEDFISEEKLQQLFLTSQINKSIYLASPSLHLELTRWCNKEVHKTKDRNKLAESFFKYLVRATSKCSPFGMFAGCSLGKINKKTSLVRNDENFKIHSRFNVTFLKKCMETEIESLDPEEIEYSINSSLYPVQGGYRYIESYISQSKLKFHVSELPKTIYLDHVLRISKNGITLGNLTKNLLQEFSSDIDINQVKQYVNELIESKVLISSFELSATGPTAIEQFKQMFELHNEPKNQKLVKLNQLLKNFNNLESSNFSQYKEKLERISSDFSSQKSAIEAEIYPKFKNNFISEGIISKARIALSFLNSITYYPQEQQLENFKDKFLERFGERRVALSLALDLESGIPFKSFFSNGDNNPLVDDLNFNPIIKEQKITWNKFHEKLKVEIDDAIKNGSSIIQLDKAAWNESNNSWNDLPTTFAVMISVHEIDGKEKIVFKGSGGSSAANLISRFSHGSKSIKAYIENITKFEEQASSGKLVVEIAHIPEPRIFNIINRPSFRSYEIPYLSNSLKINTDIDINDILLHVEHGERLVLSSKKLQQEIIPRLTNAHSYQNRDTLPIYEFLAEMQYYKLRKTVYFEIGPFKSYYDYIPRIEFQDVILSKATWNLKLKDIKSWFSLKDDWEKLKLVVEQTLKEKKIPLRVNLVDGDDEIMICFSNYNSVLMFMNVVKRRISFELVEDLFSNNSVVINTENEMLKHEVLIGMYDSRK